MTNNEYFKTLDPALRLTSFTFQGRDDKGNKIGHPGAGWHDVQAVKAGDNALALVLGEQRDGSYVYCLDFDKDYEEAGLVHLEALEKGLELYLEKTRQGGHVVIRTDGKVDLCGKQVIYKTAPDGGAHCEQLGAGQCVYIYPTPEKGRPCGSLNKIIPADEGARFIRDVMARYEYQPAPTVPPREVNERPDSREARLPLKGEEAKREGGLDSFNQDVDLVLRKLEAHGFQPMGEDDKAYRFKRPGRSLDGDASILLYKEATRGKNLRIQTLSHHMNTPAGETTSPSMFFQKEGLESVSSLLRFTSENGYGGAVREVKVIPPRQVLEPALNAGQFDPTIPESWITFDKQAEDFKILRSPADAIRYGLDHAEDKGVYQPSHLFPASPVGMYFSLRNKITLNPQSNGFILAMFASIASMTARVFRSRHYGTWFDKPAFLSMFLARTASGKDDVLKASRCLWRPFTNGFREEWNGFPRPVRDVVKKVKNSDGSVVEVQEKEEFPLIQFLTLDKICSYSGNVEASGPAMAKNVLLKGSHSVLADEIQDQFVKKVNGKYQVVDKSSDLGKMLKEVYTHDEGQYDASECKDDSNNIRPVYNPALTLFGTGTPNDLFVDYIDRESVEGGLRARLCVWKGWAYTDSRTFNPFDAIRKNREIQSESRELETNGDKMKAEKWAYQLGRLYALLLLKNADLQKDSDGRIRYDVTRECPPIEIEWEDDAVDDYICYLAWIAEERDLSDDDVAIMNRAQNKFSNLCLLYALSRLALTDETLEAVRSIHWSLGCMASLKAGALIRDSLRVNRDDVRNAFKFIVWDVVQMGVLRARPYDVREEKRVEREGGAWRKIFELSPYELDGEKVITLSWLAKTCEKRLLREVGLPQRPEDCRREIEGNPRRYPLERSEIKVRIERLKQKAYAFRLVLD